MHHYINCMINSVDPDIQELGDLDQHCLQGCLNVGSEKTKYWKYFSRAIMLIKFVNFFLFNSNISEKQKEHFHRILSKLKITFSMFSK